MDIGHGIYEINSMKNYIEERRYGALKKKRDEIATLSLNMGVAAFFYSLILLVIIIVFALSKAGTFFKLTMFFFAVFLVVMTWWLILKGPYKKWSKLNDKLDFEKNRSVSFIYQLDLNTMHKFSGMSLGEVKDICLTIKHMIDLALMHGQSVDVQQVIRKYHNMALYACQAKKIYGDGKHAGEYTKCLTQYEMELKGLKQDLYKLCEPYIADDFDYWVAHRKAYEK